jgi:hypothetical protein
MREVERWSDALLADPSATWSGCCMQGRNNQDCNEEIQKTN